MKRYVLILICGLGLFSFTQAASSADRSSELIESCREAVGIFDKHNKKRLLAGFTTGPSEAMMAGYCRGVIIEYRRQKRSNCYAVSWLDQAETIARQPLEKYSALSVDRLLRKSCDN